MKTGGLINKVMSRRDFYMAFLVLLGGNYPQYDELTRGERDALSRFMELSWENEKFRYNLFGKAAKELVRKRMDATKTNVDRYISIIRSKGYIVKDADGIDALIQPLQKIIQTDELELRINYKVEDHG